MNINNFKFSNSRLYRIGMILMNSAPFAMLLSLGLFWFEMYRNDQESEELISELQLIEESLSTRYIGIFPDYLEEINNILESAEDDQQIVVFEDVLYYGLFYNAPAFKQMINNITSLAEKNHQITIAHYGLGTRMFREVVQESRIETQYLSQLKKETTELSRELRKANPEKNGRENRLKADSIVSQKYFEVTRSGDPKAFKETVDLFRTAIYQQGDAPLFHQLDSIRTKYMSKDYSKITFADFYNMYSSVSQAISNSLKTAGNGNVELIELEDYLVMSCWSNSKQILFALPGKFAADEIGFISRDEAINNYIKTQLSGVKRLD